MSPRSAGRITVCTPAEATSRRDQARAFLDVAEIVVNEQATDLLQTVDLPDPTLPATLRRILNAKDSAHYSPKLISKTDAQALVRRARTMVETAERL